jgi:glycine/D-amino acid oxidase-like deaminating enzyme
MPFPPADAHSLTHVRYTPHRTWVEPHDQPPPLPMRAADGPESERPSLFEHMVRDVRRFVPQLGDVRYLRSLWEVKTLLPQSERDDSRPILFRQSALAPRVVSVLGAKIDNVIDLRERISRLLG